MQDLIIIQELINETVESIWNPTMKVGVTLEQK